MNAQRNGRQRYDLHVMPSPGQRTYHGNGRHRLNIAHSGRVRAIRTFWRTYDAGDWDTMKTLFTGEGFIDWVVATKRLTVEEFIALAKTADSDGPLRITLQRMEVFGNKAVTAAEIREPKTGETWHVVSFFTFSAEKIHSIVEYRTDGARILTPELALLIGDAMPSQQSFAL
ncbi:MAG: nuclear transport factor 2 family protein [Sphaerochaetaceae bacterium]|jgi:hypothetical protein